MKKKLIVVGIIFLLITGLAGCVEEKINNENEEPSDTLSNLGYRQYGFGINPPGEIQTNATTTIWKTNWTMNESIYGVTFNLDDENQVTLSVFRNPSITMGNGTFIEENGIFTLPIYSYEYEINYAIENQSINEYGETLTEIYTQNILTNVSFISNTTTTINGMNAYVSVFSGLWNETMYKQKRIYVEKNGVVFLLTYSALETLYDNYVSVVDESINSFIIQ